MYSPPSWREAGGVGAQTAREALIGELIGDVDALLARADALRTALPEAVGQSAARLEAAGGRLRVDFERDGEALLRELRAVAREAEMSARIVDGSGRRFLLFALVTGFAGGIFGGALAGLALAQVLLK